MPYCNVIPRSNQSLSSWLPSHQLVKVKVDSEHLKTKEKICDMRTGENS
uniref:Uncharacterized protein n=1 Tax=Rhizophora mucronata TaxID=61149 RepID=A0A2P2PWW7_RHIMU